METLFSISCVNLSEFIPRLGQGGSPCDKEEETRGEDSLLRFTITDKSKESVHDECLEFV